MDFLAPEAIAQLAILGFVFFMLLNSAAIMVYVERKVAARIQQRMGPTLVGPYGAQWERFAAGSIIVSVPVMALFYYVQRHLVAGLASGGVKG